MTNEFKYKTVIKSKKGGKVSYANDNFFTSFEKELSELANEKVMIVPLVMPGDVIDQYDEITEIYSNKQILTVELQSIADNFITE